MKTTLLTAAAWACFFATTQAKYMYCNRGTAGDGTCKKQGYFTFCVRSTTPVSFYKTSSSLLWAGDVSLRVGLTTCGFGWNSARTRKTRTGPRST
jgi:hypothetical protein